MLEVRSGDGDYSLISQTGVQEAALTRTQRCRESNPQRGEIPLGRAGEGDRFPLGVWGAGGQQPDQGSRTSSGVPRR